MTAAFERPPVTKGKATEVQFWGVWYTLKSSSPLRGLSLRESIRRIWYIITESDMDFSEFQGAVLALMCGVWFSLPFYDNIAETFPVFRVLLSYAPNEIWASAFIVLGISRFIGLLSGLYRVRRGACICAIALWGFSSGLLAWGEWRAISVPFMASFFLSSILEYIRMGSRSGRNGALAK